MSAIAFWRALQYAGAGDWLDESGNGHDAALNGPLFLSYDGFKYYRYNIPTTGAGYITIAHDPLMNFSADFEMRYEMRAISWVVSNTPILFQRYVATGNNRVFRFQANGTTRGIRMRLENGAGLDGDLPTRTCTAAQLPDNQWVQIRIKLDADGNGGNKKLTLWVRPAGLDLNSDLGWELVGDFSGLSAAPQTWKAGNTAGAALPSYDQPGTPTNFRYRRVMVWTDYAKQNLAIDLNFDSLSEPYKTGVEDANGLAVAYNYATTGVRGCTVDQDLFLCAVDDRFDVAHDALLDFAAADPFSIFGYARVHSITPASAQVLYAKKDDLTTALGESVYLDTDGRLKGVISDGVASPVAQSDVLLAGYAFTYGFIRDRVAGTLQMVLNGVASGSPVTDTTTLTLANTRPVRFAASSHATPASFLNAEIMTKAVFREAVAPELWAQLDRELRDEAPPSILAGRSTGGLGIGLGIGLGLSRVR